MLENEKELKHRCKWNKLFSFKKNKKWNTLFSSETTNKESCLPLFLKFGLKWVAGNAHSFITYLLKTLEMSILLIHPLPLYIFMILLVQHLLVLKTKQKQKSSERHGYCFVSLA